MKLFKNSTKAHGSAELRAEIEALDLEREQASERLEILKTSWNDVLLQDDDVKAETHQAAMAREQRAIDRAALKIAPLTQDLAAAISKETNEARLVKYKEAKARAIEVAMFLYKEHDKIKQRIFDLFETLANAELQVEAANAELPDGVEPLPGIEDSVRSRPSLPRELVKEEEFEAWTVKRGYRPILPQFQKSVREFVDHPGTFYFVDDYGVQQLCEKRLFRRTTYRPATVGRFPYSLFSQFRWPEFMADDIRNATVLAAWERPDHEAILGRLKFERERVPGTDAVQERSPVEEINLVEG